MSNLGFWGKLKKPILCLAPMADVTDCAFRQIIAKYSEDTRPTERSFGRVFWTEFVSADGLAHPVARKKLLIDFIFGENERPIVAQIFGANVENIKKASALCKELGFDGIDINMGCPDKTIEKQCAGAAMMKNPALAREVIRAAIEGGGGLPVSVKTRIGYNPPAPKGFGRAGKNDHLLDVEWIKALLSEDLAALTVHLRTRKEMSDVPAHWDLMKRIVEIRNEMKKDTLILGNGDVMSLKEAREKCKETGCDGIMLGRAIFGNPWLFSEQQNAELNNFEDGRFRPQDGVMSKNYSIQLIKEKLRVMVEHTKLFEKMLGKHKNFAIMKKHYKAYANGFEGAKELRVKLMETENAKQVEKVVNEFLAKLGKIC